MATSLLVFVFAALSCIKSATLTVGTGTAASCTYDALKSTITGSSSGDTINFNCGSSTCNLVTIPLQGSLWIRHSLTIDGSITSGSNNKIILDGQNQHRPFIVATNFTYYGLVGKEYPVNYVYGDPIQFTLSDIILQNGGSTPSTNEAKPNCRPNWQTPTDNCYIPKGEVIYRLVHCYGSPKIPNKNSLCL